MKNETYITLRNTIKKLNEIRERDREKPYNFSNYIIYEFSSNPFTNDEMEVLFTFKSISQKDIRKSQIPTPWDNDPLFVLERNKMLISHDLQFYLRQMIIIRLKERIDSFVNYFKYSPIIDRKLYENALIEMDFQIIHEVLSDRTSPMINPNSNQEMEINLSAIRSILDDVNSNYDFSIVEIENI